MNQFRRGINDGLAVGLDDERSGIQAHQQPFHQVSKGIVPGGDVCDRPGDIRFADTDPHSSGSGSRSKPGHPQCRNHGYYQKKADQILLNSFHFSSLTFPNSFPGSVFPSSPEQRISSL